MKYEINKKQEARYVCKMLWRVSVYVFLVVAIYAVGNYNGSMYAFDRTREWRDYTEQEASTVAHDAYNDRDQWRDAYYKCKQERAQCQF